MSQELDVLLVDDDKDICIMVQTVLKFAGYQVQSCSNPDQVQQIIHTSTPRLLLMDLSLSGTDGRDVCRRVKADPLSSHVRIIMMSAHSDAGKSCLEAGADDFVAKPFDMNYFISKVKAQLSTRG
jgi:DNA-binding response OmpR family regulator